MGRERDCDELPVVGQDQTLVQIHMRDVQKEYKHATHSIQRVAPMSHNKRR